MSIGSILNKAWIACCTRVDVDEVKQPPYIHSCGCPIASTVATTLTKDASMCGTDDPAETDVPRTFYKEKTITGEVNRYLDGPQVDTTTYERDEDGDCSSSLETVGSQLCQGWSNGGLYYETFYQDITNPVVTGFFVGDFTSSTTPDCYRSSTKTLVGTSCEVVISAVGGIDWSVNVTDPQSNCSYVSAGGFYEGFTVVGSGTFPVQTAFGLVDPDGGRFNWTQHVSFDDCPSIQLFDSGSLPASLQSYDTTLRYGPALNQSGTEGTVYSDEDTEADALDAATEVEGDELETSLYEQRTTGRDFIKRTVTYAIKGSNLIKGAHYKALVLIERRPAILDPDDRSYVDADGNPSVWETTDDSDVLMLDEYIFEAATYEQIVPTTGTWSDTNTDGIIDHDEVTQLLSLPNVQGWEYRIATGYPKIQLALTSETP